MSDRMWEDSVAMGLRNRELIELAQHHCTLMEFVQSSGRGMAEEATGLPINMRRIECPVAHDKSMAANLEFTVPGFFREHCVGCEMRRPTGVVPNLASVVEERDAELARAEVAEAERLAARREEWRQRGLVRQALAARFDDVTASVVRDIGELDADPGSVSAGDSGVKAGSGAADEALARLRALAQRAPEVFGSEVVEDGVGLVTAGLVPVEFLDVLRVVALARPEFAGAVVGAALSVLRRSPSVPAGRCVADLIAVVSPDELDVDVCRSMVVLAGAPSGDGFMQSRRVTDPVGLLAVVGVVPDVVEDVLSSMLPGPPPATGLVLPPGAGGRPVESLFHIGSAAGAVRVLSETDPGLAARLVGPLIVQLSSDVFDREEGTRGLKRALAVMLVRGVGEVSAAMVEAGARGSEELGERLMGVLRRAQDLASGEPRRRETEDPIPSAERGLAVAEELFDLAMGRMGGDWGSKAIAESADLVEEIAQKWPQEFLGRAPALVGTVLALVTDLDAVATPALEVVGGESLVMRGLRASSDRMMRNSAIHRLLKALKALAEEDARPVLGALVDALAEERDSARGSDATWYLLDAVGEIAAAEGDQPGVLAAALPVLHTYLVGTDVADRAQAIDAWTEIGRRHQLPSSLVDLLPALAGDPMVMVARALVRATTALEWPPQEVPRLLLHAATVMDAFKDGSNGDGLREAFAAALKMAQLMDDVAGNVEVYPAVEKRVLEFADCLDPYGVEKVLSNRSWGPAAARSTQMASLWLRLAADPVINDRINHRDDDPELVALLACGAGLTGLDVARLRDAALDLGPDRPLAAMEFVEVPWRAARVADAVAIVDALLAVIPDQPAYARQRTFFDIYAAALRMDAAATAGDSGWARHAQSATATVATMLAQSDSAHIKGVLARVEAIVSLRRLVMDQSEVGAASPAEGLRERADRFVAAGKTLADASVVATPTGVYLKAVAAVCEIVSHLFLAEAAAFDADLAQVEAHGEAARRRAELVTTELDKELGGEDPLGGPLSDLVRLLAAHPHGSPVTPLLGQWQTLPLPVPVVEGSRRRVSGSTGGPARPAHRNRRAAKPVAVAMASLDGQLVTGPAVLRHGRVYELALRVQAGEWPDWVDRLDVELLSHLTRREVTTPAFSWGRGDHSGDGETFEQAGSVVLNYRVAAGTPAPPLLLRLTWRGVVDGEPRSQTLDVAGHRELRLRPYDETRDRATDWPVFDERLLAMYDRLAREGYDQDQLQAFCRLFTSICRAGLAITWEKKYRRGARVLERDFHDDIHDRLMADPELGGRVERGTPLALGLLDVRHDGITAELKVERQTAVTRDRAPKYMGQPTQYAAANGARLSILTVLDMSPKLAPIGTPENYLFELVPRLHGLDNPEAPSLVAVLVVNGNLPTPSSWSRRKTEVRESGERRLDSDASTTGMSSDTDTGSGS